jgi:hypothetical protein
MAYTAAWRNFRRMQQLSLTFAALALVADGIAAWPILPGSVGLKAAVILAFPLGYAVVVAVIGLGVRPLRSFLQNFVWMSFKAGFGQSVFSVLLSVTVLSLITAYTYWVSAGAAHGGQYPAGAFSGFGAGVGILIVQTTLTYSLQADPWLRGEIEERDEGEDEGEGEED